MAFDGGFMISRAKAVGKAALVRAHLNGAERKLQDGIDAALDAGRQDIADKLAVCLVLLEKAHGKATEAATLIAAHFNEPDVSLFSGGDDKPPPPDVP